MGVPGPQSHDRRADGNDGRRRGRRALGIADHHRDRARARPRGRRGARTGRVMALARRECAAARRCARDPRRARRARRPLRRDVEGEDPGRLDAAGLPPHLRAALDDLERSAAAADRPHARGAPRSRSRRSPSSSCSGCSPSAARTAAGARWPTGAPPYPERRDDRRERDADSRALAAARRGDSQSVADALHARGARDPARRRSVRRRAVDGRRAARPRSSPAT